MLTIIPVLFAAPQSCRWKQNGCDWLFTDTDGNNNGYMKNVVPTIMAHRLVHTG